MMKVLAGCIYSLIQQHQFHGDVGGVDRWGGHVFEQDMICWASNLSILTDQAMT